MISNFKITDHFTFYELTNTDYFGYLDINREEGFKKIYTLTDLCIKILEPIRLIFNKPVIINSGFRCIEVNKLVGGKSNSQHLLGEAVDFKIKGENVVDVFNEIQKTDLMYGQLINEYNKWIHVSLGYPYRKKKDSMQVFTVGD